MERVADLGRRELLRDRVGELRDDGRDELDADVLGEGQLLTRLRDERLDLRLVGGASQVVLGKVSKKGESSDNGDLLLHRK